MAQIGVGGLRSKPCFRFDFTSFRVGCAATHANCDFNVTGLSWDNEAQQEVVVGSQNFSVRSCAVQRDCALNKISALSTGGLTNLTTLLIDVTTDGESQRWWADDIVFHWTDGSCESAVCRSQIHDDGPRRSRRLSSSRLFDAQH